MAGGDLTGGKKLKIKKGGLGGTGNVSYSAHMAKVFAANKQRFKTETLPTINTSSVSYLKRLHERSDDVFSTAHTEDNVTSKSRRHSKTDVWTADNDHDHSKKKYSGLHESRKHDSSDVWTAENSRHESAENKYRNLNEGRKHDKSDVWTAENNRHESAEKNYQSRHEAQKNKRRDVWTAENNHESADKRYSGPDITKPHHENDSKAEKYSHAAHISTAQTNFNTQTARDLTGGNTKTLLRTGNSNNSNSTLKTGKSVKRDIKIVKGSVPKNKRITTKDLRKIKTGNYKIVTKTKLKIKLKYKSKLTIKNLRNKSKILLKKAGHKVLHKGKELVKREIVSDLKLPLKMADIGVSALQTSNNDALATTGKTIRVVQTSAQLIQTGGIAAVKTSIKVGKGAKRVRTGIKYVKKHGIKNAGKALGRSAVAASKTFVKKALSSVAKALIKHVAVPVVIVAAVAVCMIFILGGAAAAVGSIYSGVTTVVNGIKGTITDIKDWFLGKKDKKDDEEYEPVEVNIQEYLMVKIQETKKNMGEDVIKELKSKGDYYEVRFYNSELDMEIPIDPNISKSKNKINRMMYSDQAIYEMVDPIYEAILLNEEFEMTDMKDMNDLYKEVTKDLFVLKSKEKIEYCSAEPCNEYHASSNCPNKVSGYHSDTNDCKDCCRSSNDVCAGHFEGYKCGIDEHDHHNDDFPDDPDQQATAMDATYHFMAKSNRKVGDEWSGWRLIHVGACAVECVHGGDLECTGHTHDGGCEKYCYHWHDGSYSEDRPGGSDAYLEYDCGALRNDVHCTGYNYCKGHKIKLIYFETKDVEKIISSYFDDRIKEAEKKVGDNEKQLEKQKNKKKPDEDKIDELEERLHDSQESVDSLKETKENCYAYLDVVRENLGLDDPDDDGMKYASAVNLQNKYAVKAREQVGKPFVFEGEDPDKGFDDIGLVKYVYGEKLNDVSSYVELAKCDAFDFEHTIEEDREGALILYTYGAATVDSKGNEKLDDLYDPENIYHVGISLGNGYMVHATGSPATKENKAGMVKVSKISQESVMKIGFPKE